MKPPYVIIRGGLYYLGNFGPPCWIKEKEFATKFFNLSICEEKAVEVHGFVIGTSDTDNPTDFFTVRLTVKICNRPGFDVTVRGVSRENVAELQRAMLAHVVTIDGLMSASVELFT
jgi:hypothetical protein